METEIFEIELRVDILKRLQRYHLKGVKSVNDLIPVIVEEYLLDLDEKVAIEALERDLNEKRYNHSWEALKNTN